MIDRTQSTALHYAAKNCNRHIVELLLAFNAGKGKATVLLPVSAFLDHYFNRILYTYLNVIFTRRRLCLKMKMYV